MHGVAKDFYDVNKIVSNLLDDNEINMADQSVLNAQQFSYQATSGKMFNVMIFSTMAPYP